VLLRCNRTACKQNIPVLIQLLSFARDELAFQAIPRHLATSIYLAVRAAMKVRANISGSGKRVAASLIVAAALATVVAVDGATVRRAWAFDETLQGATEPDQATRLQGIQIVPQSTSRGTGMELTVPSESLGGFAPKGGGSGLVIPGLGALPKLDFGLELLYGSPDQGVATPDQADPPPNALTVHGSVKKTF
jgi:hypothetical protein